MTAQNETVDGTGTQTLEEGHFIPADQVGRFFDDVDSDKPYQGFWVDNDRFGNTKTGVLWTDDQVFGVFKRENSEVFKVKKVYDRDELTLTGEMDDESAEWLIDHLNVDDTVEEIEHYWGHFTWKSFFKGDSAGVEYESVEFSSQDIVVDCYDHEMGFSFQMVLRDFRVSPVESQEFTA